MPRATNAVAATFVGAGAATYQVPIACVRKAPTLTVSPAQQQGAPNVPATYTVSVTNHDSGCVSSSFGENVTAPAGWTAAFSLAALSPNPGATPTTMMTVKPASAAVGNGWTEAKGDFSVKAGEPRSGPMRALHMALLPAVAGSKESVAASFASTDITTARASG